MKRNLAFIAIFFAFASSGHAQSAGSTSVSDGWVTVNPSELHGAINNPLYELYDIQNDPYELVNLAGDPKHAETVKKMTADLKTEITSLKDSMKETDGKEADEE